MITTKIIHFSAHIQCVPGIFQWLMISVKGYWLKNILTKKPVGRGCDPQWVDRRTTLLQKDQTTLLSSWVSLYRNVSPPKLGIIYVCVYI